MNGKMQGLRSKMVAVTTGAALAGSLFAAAPAVAAPSVAQVSPSVVSAAAKSISKVTIKTKVNLNVRSKDSTKGKQLGVLKKGTKVTSTYRANSGWYRISYKGKTGYISNKSQFVSVSSAKVSKPSKTSSKAKTISKVTIKTKVSLNVRSKDSTKGKQLGVLKKGSKVTSTYRANSGWYRISYKGKTGYISNSSQFVSGSSAKVSKPSKPSKPSTKAKLKTSYGNKYAGLTYATIDGGVNWNKSVGLMVFLDGDYWSRGYKNSISEHPSGSKAKAMAKTAAKRNMVLVIPRLPSQGYTKSLGYTWWGKSSTVAPMVKKLDSYLRGKAGVARSNTWYMGYSGGAEFISFELAKRGQSAYGNGGAILLAGGGSPRSMSGASSTFKKNFDMHWVVGSRDGAGQSSNAQSWSAYNATNQGRNFYKSKGFKTSRTVLSGQNHHSYNLASIMNIGLKKGGK